MRTAKAICLGLATLFGSQTMAAPPVETHGAMQVVGNRIVDKNGIIFYVSGMSLYWSGWMGKYWNAQVVNTLANTWKCGVIRASMGVEGGSMYLSDPNNNKTMVKTVVDAAIANGIYVIIDWHDHNANKNVTQAKAFFSEMAQLYKNTPNVIWEIWNEPDDVGGIAGAGDTWVGDIKPYAETITAEIRKYSSNLIIVGTSNWSQDVDVAAASPLADKNTAYTLHFYAKTHGSVLRGKANRAMAAGAALFITEWGTTVSDGGTTDKIIDTVSSNGWLSWAQNNRLSWANWSIADKDEGSAALTGGASTNGSWSDGNLSASGKYVKPKILAISKVVFTESSVAQRGTFLPGFSVHPLVGGVQVTLPVNARELTVMDLQGKILHEKHLSSETTLPLQLPGKGLYLIQVVSSQGLQTLPVVLSR